MLNSVISHRVVSPVSTAKAIVSSVVPKSLSAVDMLKYSKIIKPVEKKILNVWVEELDIESNECVVLGAVSFVKEIAPFAEGDFRHAFKTTSNHDKFKNATCVIKRYKTSALERIKMLKQSRGIQSRKVVQTNSLARNLAARFSDRCVTVIEHFSKIVYNKMFFGKIDENEFVTFEKFIPAAFQKCINNYGTIVNVFETSADGLKKIEAFAYYTFKKSEGNLMVLDIQDIVNV